MIRSRISEARMAVAMALVVLLSLGVTWQPAIAVADEPTARPTPTLAPTWTATATETATATITPTPTDTGTPTLTPTSTATFTPTPTQTGTPTLRPVTPIGTLTTPEPPTPAPTQPAGSSGSTVELSGTPQILPVVGGAAVADTGVQPTLALLVVLGLAASGLYMASRSFAAKASLPRDER